MGTAGKETGPTKAISHYGCGTYNVGSASVPA